MNDKTSTDKTTGTQPKPATPRTGSRSGGGKGAGQPRTTGKKPDRAQQPAGDAQRGDSYQSGRRVWPD